MGFSTESQPSSTSRGTSPCQSKYRPGAADRACRHSASVTSFSWLALLRASTRMVYACWNRSAVSASLYCTPKRCTSFPPAGITAAIRSGRAVSAGSATASPPPPVDGRDSRPDGTAMLWVRTTRYTAEQLSSTIKRLLIRSTICFLLRLLMARPLNLQLHAHRQAGSLPVHQLQHALMTRHDLLGDGQA